MQRRSPGLLVDSCPDPEELLDRVFGKKENDKRYVVYIHYSNRKIEAMKIPADMRYAAIAQFENLTRLHHPHKVTLELEG